MFLEQPEDLSLQDKLVCLLFFRFVLEQFEKQPEFSKPDSKFDWKLAVELQQGNPRVVEQQQNDFIMFANAISAFLSPQVLEAKQGFISHPQYS